ncbi:hypothetical protein B481_0128 [Planococcus halocryophilus Or1]|uniref:Homeodomain phBC6A51-type domain-containing protein n=1 Tax=Planococcus halocryophilus TaxID=1215089 RepID=A0A1C7DM93_9BACL|nr:hypothetical protein [Planococcus halocryophilus]ANU12547.1 hypothetical protein BBI08_01160 [Planococcus halocryophilus]EMF48293.1 hypothetical protein B481_0128 [Planococcus halocryophilus Or1]
MATAKETIFQLFEKVDVPNNLSDRNVEIAKSYAMNQLSDRISMVDWCKQNELSTKTFYAWKKDIRGFESYVNQLIDNSVDDSVKDALLAMDKHVVKLAYQTSVTPAEVKIFGEYFGYALEARKRQYLKDNGLDDSGDKTTLSPEQRKNNLLKRLQGDK